MNDKSFQIALAVSALIHSLAFISISPRLIKMSKKENTIKISYKKNLPAYTHKSLLKKEIIEVKDRRHNADRMIEAARADKTQFKAGGPLAAADVGQFIPKPLSMKESFPALKKRVTLPTLEMNVKVKSPSYSHYYELIREKIRHTAYRNYSQTETGEIYVAFVVDTAGNLKDVRYIEDKSSPSYYLKETALRSIRESAPFPPFPGDLDYPQLSFNVIISFQIDD